MSWQTVYFCEKYIFWILSFVSLNQAWAYLTFIRAYFGYAYLLKWNTQMIIHLIIDVLSICLSFIIILRVSLWSTCVKAIGNPDVFDQIFGLWQNCSHFSAFPMVSLSDFTSHSKSRSFTKWPVLDHWNQDMSEFFISTQPTVI